MLQQGQNFAVVNNSSPSTYCFDVEAVNQFFAEDTRLIMRHCDIASGELPQEVLLAFEYLNGFSEVLDPYFTN